MMSPIAQLTPTLVETGRLSIFGIGSVLPYLEKCIFLWKIPYEKIFQK